MDNIINGKDTDRCIRGFRKTFSKFCKSSRKSPQRNTVSTLKNLLSYTVIAVLKKDALKKQLCRLYSKRPAQYFRNHRSYTSYLAKPDGQSLVASITFIYVQMSLDITALICIREPSNSITATSTCSTDD